MGIEGIDIRYQNRDSLYIGCRRGSQPTALLISPTLMVKGTPACRCDSCVNDTGNVIGDLALVAPVTPSDRVAPPIQRPGSQPTDRFAAEASLLFQKGIPHPGKHLAGHSCSDVRLRVSITPLFRRPRFRDYLPKKSHLYSTRVKLLKMSFKSQGH